MAAHGMISDGGASNRSSPVIVFDRSDGAWAFVSYSSAEEWMEPVDVVDGEYDAYDADGYVLGLSVNGGAVRLGRSKEIAYEAVVKRLESVIHRSSIVTAAGSLRSMILELVECEKRAGPPHGICAKLLRSLRLWRTE